MINISFAVETPSSWKPWPLNTNTATASSPRKLLFLVRKHCKGFAKKQMLALTVLPLGLFYKCILGKLGAHRHRARKCTEEEEIWFWSQLIPSAVWKQPAPLGFCRLPNPCKTSSRTVLEFKSLQSRALSQEKTFAGKTVWWKVYFVRDFLCFPLMQR